MRRVRSTARLAVVAAAFLVFAAVTRAETIHVPGDQPTIQAGILAASDGDEIIVAPGTYHEAINLLGKAVTLRSSDGPDVTIIDASMRSNVSTVTMSSGEGADTIIEGFTITGGSGTTVIVFEYGGGVLIQDASPQIVNCIIAGNTAQIGAGMAALGGHLTLLDSMIEQNHATWSGGGGAVIEAGALIEGSAFSENTAVQHGGAMYIEGSQVELNGNTFTRNAANSGGAVSICSGLVVGSMVTVNGCSFSENGHTRNGITSTFGGAIRANNCQLPEGDIVALTIIDSEFVLNHSSDSGGAIRSEFTVGLISNSVFTGNSVGHGGGAIYLRSSSPTILNTTFTGNHAMITGGAILLSLNATPQIQQSTFVRNLAGQAGGAIYSLTTSPGVGNSSLCNNLPNDIFGDWTNQGGNTFPDDCPLPPMPGDLNGDGTVDVFDLLLLLAAWGPCEDTTSCPADLTHDGEVDVFDLLLLLTLWGSAPTCEGHCGGASNGACWCDEACCFFADCCDDKLATCGGCDPEAPIESCFGFCGRMAPTGCWCDEACCTFLDCCLDVKVYCGECGDIFPSCQGNCGGQAPGGCWCDELCCSFMDCCDDEEIYCQICPIP